MSDYTPYSLKHFTILRKILKSKQSGTMLFQTASNDRRQLHLSQGNIIHNGEAYMIATLDHFFSKQITSIAWRKETVSDNGEQSTSSLESVCKSLNHVTWTPSQLQRLAFEFSKLPSIDVRMVALHPYHFKDSMTYLQFYQKSLLTNNFKPADFLKDSTAFTSRIRVLVLAYCLNLFVPHTNTVKAQKQHNSNASSNLAQRILLRIRGI